MNFAQRTRVCARAHVLGRVLPGMIRPRPRPGEPLVIDGRWVVPRWLSPGGIAYCAGIGEEITLELQLIALFSMQVWGFDPTPRAIRFIERASPNPRFFHFVPAGLWSEDTTLFFQAPDNPDHVSHSLLDADEARSGFQGPVRRLASIMKELGHDNLELLKMNIEGAEEAVLTTLLEDSLRPRCIALSYEARDSFREAIRWTSRLRNIGYRCLGIRGWAVTYVLD